MKRRHFLSSALPGAAALAAAPAILSQQGSRKPNIIWIMADDMGYAEMGCYGQRIIRTPNCDRLATEGTRFTDAYAGCTVCAPSRSVLLTGKHMGVTSVRSNPGGVPILPADITAGEVLKQAGYTTGCFGKWGLGDIGTEGVPWKQGFDEFVGFLHQVHAHYHYPSVIYDNDRELPLEGNANKGYQTFANDVIARRGLEFIRKNRSAPFLAYFPFTAPHSEFHAPDEILDTYRDLIPEREPSYVNHKRFRRQDHPRAAYAALCTRFDQYVGQITALIGELGLADNTLIVVTSDNGGTKPAEDPEDFFNSNGPFRGAKRDMYEGGLRVPMIARWPGRIPAGRVSEFAWMFQDFLPTAADLANVAAPGGVTGKSVVPTLMGQRQRPHEYLYWEFPRHNTQTGEFRDEVPMQALRLGNFKAVRPRPDAELELYNLAKDPGERVNLAAEAPKVLERAQAILKEVRVAPRTQTHPDHNWNTRS